MRLLKAAISCPNNVILATSSANNFQFLRIFLYRGDIMQIVAVTPPPMHAPSVFFKALWYRSAFSTAPGRKILPAVQADARCPTPKDRSSSLLIDIDDKLAVRLPVFNEIVRDRGICKREAAPIELWHHLSYLDQSGGFPHDIAVMRATLA
jgi:hypothetical protein